MDANCRPIRTAEADDAAAPKPRTDTPGPGGRNAGQPGRPPYKPRTAPIKGAVLGSLLSPPSGLWRPGSKPSGRRLQADAARCPRQTQKAHLHTVPIPDRVHTSRVHTPACYHDAGKPSSGPSTFALCANDPFEHPKQHIHQRFIKKADIPSGTRPQKKIKSIRGICENRPHTQACRWPVFGRQSRRSFVDHTQACWVSSPFAPLRAHTARPDGRLPSQPFALARSWVRVLLLSRGKVAKGLRSVPPGATDSRLNRSHLLRGVRNAGALRPPCAKGARSDPDCSACVPAALQRVVPGRFAMRSDVCLFRAGVAYHG